MSFDLFRTGVPCLKCDRVIESWTGDDRAVPCGHFWDEIVDAVEVQIVLLEARRVRFGEYATEVAE